MFAQWADKHVIKNNPWADFFAFSRQSWPFFIYTANKTWTNWTGSFSAKLQHNITKHQKRGEAQQIEYRGAGLQRRIKLNNLPELHLQSRRVSSAGLGLCGGISQRPCVCWGKPRHGFLSSPSPGREKTPSLDHPRRHGKDLRSPAKPLVATSNSYSADMCRNTQHKMVSELMNKEWNQWNLHDLGGKCRSLQLRRTGCLQPPLQYAMFFIYEYIMSC